MNSQYSFNFFYADNQVQRIKNHLIESQVQIEQPEKEFGVAWKGNILPVYSYGDVWNFDVDAVRDLGISQNEYRNLRQYLQDRQLEILSFDVMKRINWGPPTSLSSEIGWISICTDTTIQKVVAYYYGGFTTDDQGRLASVNSYINVRPDYRGKGLCLPLANFTYKELGKYVNYICIRVAAEIVEGACRCYVKAALDSGYIVYYGSNLESLERWNDREMCKKMTVDESKHLLFVIPQSSPDLDMVKTCGLAVL